MPQQRPSSFPWVAAIAVLGSLGWALSGTQLPPADFTFVNGTEVKSLDPALVTGSPENRMMNAISEGLVRWNPETLVPMPGSAESWEISDDGLVYTFKIREEAKWSDGKPLTAKDFHYSWRRLLDPRTAAEYAFQAWYIKNAKRYSNGARGLRIGEPVEVEKNLPLDASNMRRGEVLRGKLIEILDAERVSVDPEELDETEEVDTGTWTFVVEIEGQNQKFLSCDDKTASKEEPPNGANWCRQVLLDFREVGIKVTNEKTLEVTLENPTAFFLNLTGFYPLFPVQRECVETHGSPQWTFAENYVGNGPFHPKFRRLRDRTRLVPNEYHWDRENLKLETVDVLAVESVTTGLNLFLTDKADWAYDVPPPALRELLSEEPVRKEVNPQPQMISYYYLLNTTRAPFDDIRVRKALSMALDREEITTRILAAGERPARSLVPLGMPSYEQQKCDPESVEQAQKLLAEAGYPKGRGFPRIDILYNTHEAHQMIAEVVRKQWQRNLGITVKSRNEEWGSYLASTHQMNYNVARKGWVADYADPDTFLNMFVTGGEQNNTGWGKPEYDQLIADAGKEVDPQRRLELLQQAERMLMDELPIVPVYFYMSKNIVKPYVRGFYNNPLDFHPVWAISIDREGKTENPFWRDLRGPK